MKMCLSINYSESISCNSDFATFNESLFKIAIFILKITLVELGSWTILQ